MIGLYLVTISCYSIAIPFLVPSILGMINLFFNNRSRLFDEIIWYRINETITNNDVGDIEVHIAKFLKIYNSKTRIYLNSNDLEKVEELRIVFTILSTTMVDLDLQSKFPVLSKDELCSFSLNHINGFDKDLLLQVYLANLNFYRLQYDHSLPAIDLNNQFEFEHLFHRVNRLPLNQIDEEYFTGFLGLVEGTRDSVNNRDPVWDIDTVGLAKLLERISDNRNYDTLVELIHSFKSYILKHNDLKKRNKLLSNSKKENLSLKKTTHFDSKRLGNRIPVLEYYINQDYLNEDFFKSCRFFSKKYSYLVHEKIYDHWFKLVSSDYEVFIRDYKKMHPFLISTHRLEYSKLFAQLFLYCSNKWSISDSEALKLSYQESEKKSTLAMLISFISLNRNSKELRPFALEHQIINAIDLKAIQQKGFRKVRIGSGTPNFHFWGKFCFPTKVTFSRYMILSKANRGF